MFERIISNPDGLSSEDRIAMLERKVEDTMLQIQAQLGFNDKAIRLVDTLIKNDEKISSNLTLLITALEALSDRVEDTRKRS